MLKLVMCIIKNFISHIMTPHIYNMNNYMSRYSSKYVAVHINMLHYSELIKLKKVSMHTHIIYVHY